MQLVVIILPLTLQKYFEHVALQEGAMVQRIRFPAHPSILKDRLKAENRSLGQNPHTPGLESFLGLCQPWLPKTPLDNMMPT